MALAACGCAVALSLWMKSEQGVPADEVRPEGAVELTFAYYGLGSSVELGKVIDEYNETNPGPARVRLLTLPSESYARTLNMLMTSGRGPDLFSVPDDWRLTYINKDWLSPMAPSQYQAAEGYPEWAIAYGKANGRSYSLPFGISTYRLAYNKDLFRQAGLDPSKPPVTLAELERYAQAITNSQIGMQRYGYAWALGEDWYGFQLGMEIPATYSGLSLFDFAKGRFQVAHYGPWLQSMMRMRESGGLLPGENSLQYGTALTQFAKGNVGMMMVSSSDVYKLRNELYAGFDWEAAMPPAVDLAHRGKGALRITPEPMIGIHADSPYQKEAVRFWNYLYSDPVLSRLYRQGSHIPAADRIRQAVDAAHEPEGRFREFLPTEAESVWPEIPLVLDTSLVPNQVYTRNIGWNNRFQAYRDAWSGNQQPVAVVLEQETERLNRVLDDAAQSNFIRRDDYIRPRFDLKNPMEHP